MVDENRIEGTIKNATGKVQEAVGGVFGDTQTQAQGKANQFAGEAQSYYGEALDTVRDVAADRPVTALVAAAGIGVVLGLLIGRL
jgi:uncharacterized protein YjbJ (UPF0337 family)